MAACSCCATKACKIASGLAVLAVAILVPVGVFVIAPKVAQNIVDKMDIRITNMTLFLPDAGKTVPAFCSMSLHNSAPIGATMDVTNITASTDKAHKGNYSSFGEFIMPETKIHPGNNQITFPSNLTITDLNTLYYLIDPPIRLQIAAKTKVSSFGLPLHVHLDKFFICDTLTQTASPLPGLTPVSIYCSMQTDINASEGGGASIQARAAPSIDAKQARDKVQVV